MYYFDTNALWKYYRDEPGSQNIRWLVAKETVVLSPLTVLEFVGVLMKYYRKKELKKNEASVTYEKLKRDIGPDRKFQLIPLPVDSFSSAESILIKLAHCSIDSFDALHIAAALGMKDRPVMATSDKAMQHACAQLGLACYDPEARDP